MSKGLPMKGYQKFFPLGQEKKTDVMFKFLVTVNTAHKAYYTFQIFERL